MDVSKRIVWVDWAKTLGIMIVVFCHVPQHSTLEKTFLCYLQMPLFFFLSGFLHKVPSTLNESLRKYWKTIIIPYILFQFIFYPYWLTKYKLEGGSITNISESFIKPFARCVYGVPIDGITWFLVALLLMKLFMDVVYKSINKHTYIGISVLASVFISYIIWSDSVVNTTFALDSLFSFFPFFVLGFYCKSFYISLKNEYQAYDFIKHIIGAILLFVLTILCILFIPIDDYLLNRFLFYVLGVTGAFCIIEFSRSIKQLPSFIIDISNGTIILLGFHWMFIGTINYVLEKILHNNEAIAYSTFEAIILVLFITLMNYYIIKFCKRHFKILLGGR